jgi:glycosyltransferase involved in cell wall biosynthesis
LKVQLHWYSPLDAQASEIARYSQQTLPYLERLLEISAVCDGSGEASAPWWPAEQHRTGIERGVAPLPVYHIGNNPQHLPIFQRSLEEPGMVVLHDLSLVDLAKHLSHHLGQPELWKEMMTRQYGDDIRGLVNRSENTVADHNEMVANYPLFQPFTAGALGVLVHSRYARQALLKQLGDTVPVRQLYLPALPSPEPSPDAGPTGPLQFIFCGHVGPNRRLLEFFEAWGALADPARLRLSLFGNIHNQRQLLQYAEHFSLADYIDFRGYVSDAELDEALHLAHFAINLRWPTMGEASASQLRYWSAALPTLVSDVGWYGELPDDTACKISVAHETADIRALLEDAIADPAKYERIGRNGWAYLQSQHSVETYATGLADFAAQLVQDRLACRTLDRDLVGLVAGMCDNETDTRLFRDAIETAVATLARANQ